jgi:tetratricopeptide (TPR) repeat protein
MASLIPGYEYDIFISYRQKDNKHDGWVTKFVENLRGELESTFKEDISIYFDENPHDRLQETHNVDKSLEGKLKCLIFIPILSQTYCDPNSYAWQYEFLAFNKLAKEDCFGRDVRLKSGNYASRILPIRIHDLDQEDIKLFEKETGSVLRAMDFVFKTTTGVNRTLKANEDHPNDNLNKTYYSDQINKVALAIKEIILGLKTEMSESMEEKPPHIEPLEEATKETREKIQVKPDKLPKQKLLTGVTGIAILVILAVLTLPKIFHIGKNKVVKDSDGRISIAVTVFENNTNDTTLNWLIKGIPELIRNNLTGSEELSVQNSQTMYELYESMEKSQNASIAPSLSREAAIKLKTGNYITGSFQRFGENILTYVKLIDTKSDELLWTGSIEGDLNKYKYLADSLSARLKDFMEIKVIKQKTSQEYSDANTNSPEALKKYVEGMQLMINGNFKSAAQYFEDSYFFDTTFTLAALYALTVYSYDGNFVPTIKWTKIAYKGKERLPYYYQLWVESCRAGNITKNCDSLLYYNDLLAQSDIKSRLFWMDIGYMYIALDQSPKAVNAFEKVEKISSEWGGYWKFIDYYIYYGIACHNAGLHDKEAKVYETGLKLFSDAMGIIYSQARCAIATGDTLKATGLINQLYKIANEQKYSESDIETGLGNLYADAKSFNKVEAHYRAALKLEPNNYLNINRLALFLINHDGDVDEADSLSKMVLKTRPEDWTALRVQGLVCYKHGNYEEALKLLEQAYTNCIVYYPPLFNDIKKVKKAVVGQKNN